MNTPKIEAVLVRLSIRIFPNTRQDPQITDEVRMQKALGLGAGKWVKCVLPDAALKDIREAGGEFRRRHYDITLPWEEGYRLLPSTAHDTYEKDFEDAQERFFAAVDAFGQKYQHPYTVDAKSDEATNFAAMLADLKKQDQAPKADKDGKVKLPSLVDQAKLMHNGTFNPNLYPDWKQMRSHFSFGTDFNPVPKAAHFIANGFASEAVAAMKTNLEKRSEERIELAVQDTWNRLLTPVKALADKLSGKETIFRDTLIGNVKEIVGLIPHLNLTQDKALAGVAKEIETKFANLDPELLRNDAAVRKEATKEAKALLSRFGSIGKRRFA